jgi:hypothetical protein
MTAERCMCGANDCLICGPLQGYSLKQPTPRHYELALYEVVDNILEYGQWPKNGRAQFDLYDYLLDNLDSSYPMETYVASLSSNDTALENRRNRERKAVTNMLLKHLAYSDFVADLAAEYAEEE